LIHRLECLIVLIEDLKIGDCCGGLVSTKVNSGEIGEGTSSDEEKESERSGKGRSELTACVEEQAGTQFLKPASRGLGLLFTEQGGETLIEVRRGLRGVPGVEERHRRLERVELAAAVSARGEVLTRGSVRWSGRIEEEIRESGLAIMADHGEPFQFLC